MYEPTIELSGHLGSDPTLRFTPNGKAVCDLRIATTPRREVGDQWVDLETLWFTATCWKQLAENVASSFHKGDRVMVRGRLGVKTYKRSDGTDASDMVIDVLSVGADVSRAPVTVKPVVREGSAASTWADKFNEPTAPPEDPGSLDAAGPLVGYDEAEHVAA